MLWCRNYIFLTGKTLFNAISRYSDVYLIMGIKYLDGTFTATSLPDGASESILADIHKEVSLLLECWLLSSAYRTWLSFSTGINTDAFLFVTASSISTIACPMNVDTSRANLLVWRYYNWCFKKWALVFLLNSRILSSNPTQHASLDHVNSVVFHVNNGQDGRTN